MAIAKFFIEPSVELESNLLLALSEQESHHAAKVRRLQVNDSVMLLNGQGLKAQALIETISKKQVQVRVQHICHVPTPSHKIAVAVAIPKGDRQKYLLDMLTQLGVARITPLLCEFSASAYSNKLMQKWQRIVIEACKQSENPFVPKLGEPLSPQEYVVMQQSQLTSVTQQAPATASQLFFADAQGQSMSQYTLSNNVHVMIGPEGGFSPTEMNYLEQQQVEKICLAEHILRIETAAVAAVANFMS